MRYISTRGGAPAVGFLDAVLAGLAPDGGLYVPERWPELTEADLAAAGTKAYHSFAGRVLHLFAGDDLDSRTCLDLCERAYDSLGGAPWAHPAVTPLVQSDWGAWRLELFHGPSLSFKDVAMQLIAELYDHALKARGRRLSVVCATSGDTGGAAVEALKSRERIDLFVLLPKGRVSDVQRLFMTTSGAENVHAIEIDGDFDACQAILKSLFAEAEFADRAALSAVNSINWARIVAQSVYFVAASSALRASEGVDFVIPTGNFGDAFSAHVAKRLGAPVGWILVATNANDIVARAMRTGRYERAAESIATISPAMDIQVASNFERLLFESLDRDADAVVRLYAQFDQSRGFDIPSRAWERWKSEFAASSANDQETAAVIGGLHQAGWGVVCPHTATAYAFKHERLDGEPVVYLATAHPAKFPDTVEQATGVRPQLPAHCADLFERKERFDELPADVEAVKKYIRERTRAWR